MIDSNRRGFLQAASAGLLTLHGARVAAAPAFPRTADDPLGIRSDFPVTERMTYLNSASTSPIPRVVHEAAVAYADEKMLNPASGTRRQVRDETRDKFAKLFGAKPEEIALLYSTTDGENIIVRGLDLKAGDNVVLDELHFNSSFILYRELEKSIGIELRMVRERDGRSRLEDFEELIDAKTRLVSVAWVSNRNGYREQMKGLVDLTHAKGALLYVDGVQALGAIDTDLREEGVDFVTANGYKWLLASFGIAPMFMREEHLDGIRPDRFGHGQSAESLPDYRYNLHESARKFEYASPAYGAVYQLHASLDYLKGVGIDRIEKHTVSLAQKLRDEVASLGFDTWTPKNNSSAIVSFAHGRKTEDVAELFKKEKISVTLREAGGSVIRASVGVFNNEEDIRRFTKVLATIA